MKEKRADILDTCDKKSGRLLKEIVSPKLTKKCSSGFYTGRYVFLIGIFMAWTFFSMGQARQYSLQKVVIDPGHGGHDSGCLGGKVKEKDVALSIGLKIGKLISDQYSDVKVIYTRTTDKFVELHERANIANLAKADLFISIHCNSACFFDKKKKKEICNIETKGAETWVMGLHKSEANLEVSKRENEVVLLEKDYMKQYDGFDPNSPEANIIFSLYQNAHLEQSLKIASYVQLELKERGRNNRGVKQAGFLVLFKTSMPSILVETGFLSNQEEERYLGSEKGQREIAEGIFQAFRSYKKSVESGTTKIEVKDSSSSSDKNNPIVKEPSETAEEEQLYFAVQFLMSPSSLKKNHSSFKGLEGVQEEKDGAVYKYTQGRYAAIDDAIQMQSQLRSKGFPDAFVVAYYNNKRISMKEARKMLEKSN